MKKIININLSGRVIPIEDSAYESLQQYIESLRRYFSNEEGRDEIINDIESRIAELMNDKVRKGATSVTDEDIAEIISSMGRVEDFEEADTAETATAKEQQAAPTPEPRKKRGRLYRDTTDKILGGVGSGIANYLDVDPAVVRILLVLFGFTGTGILLYIILWAILPAKDLANYQGKRLFRNPDDKVISGVAGGLAAYFNTQAWIIRLILAAPLILNIFFGTFNGIFFAWHRDIFPNIFIMPFTGTFVLAYIILWMVLPEAKSSFEKMEMRGETVDVNRIRRNVQAEMENVKTRAQAWGEEVKTSAQQLGSRAKEFASTRGKTVAGEMVETARPAARGLLHIIGVLFKAFFIFVAGCIALSLFAGLMVIIFGGVAWWPINNFLWTSNLQKLLAWGTILFFIAVPVIAFITWLIRRVIRVRSKSHLGWVFGGLWLIGWICAIAFAVSIANDLKSYERTSTDLAMSQPPTGKLVLKVNEPEIHYTGNTWWFRGDNAGWDVTEDTMRYDNVKVRVVKSEDSAYHVTLYKYAAGSSFNDARERANNTQFSAFVQDSILNIGSGLSIDRKNKFRGQGVIVEIHVPVGKRIRFDESVVEAYHPWVIRRYERGNRNRYFNKQYKIDWDMDDYFDWDVNVDYTMDENGKLINPNKIEENKDEDADRDPNAVGGNRDSLQRIRLEQRRVRDSMDRELKKTDRELQQRRSQNLNERQGEPTTKSDMLFISLLI